MLPKYRIELKKGNLSLVREKSFKDTTFQTPHEVASFILNNMRMKNATEEFLHIIALDTRGNALGVFEVFHGSVNLNLCSPREIMIRLLLCNATSFICVHNHPSGDPSPSGQDMESFTRLKKSGELLNVPLTDFIIVGRKDNTFISFKDRGDL